MDDFDRWIYLDGPEPEILRPALDALRAAARPTAEEKAEAARCFFERLDATLAPRRDWQPEGEVGANDVTSAAPRAPEVVATTTQAMEPPVEAPWPFTPPEQLPPEKRASRTRQTPEERPAMGGTFPLGDNTMQRAMSVLPFAESAMGTVVDFPRMTVETYASLCVELLAWPEKADETLLTYYVPSKASWEALDRHWRTFLAAQPEARSRYEAGWAQYTAYLQTRQGSPIR